MATAALAVVGLVSGAVGAGVSYYSAQSAANTQEDLADYNSVVQNHNSRMRMLASQTEANVNERMIRLEASARENNATALEQQAAHVARVTQENIRRSREDFRRIVGTQRARVGSSGVTFSGSPVEVLADTAADMQLALEDQLYGGRLESDKLNRQASLERFGASQTLISAEMAKWNGESAALQYRSDKRTIDLNLRGAYAGAAATRAQGTASALSSLSSTASSGYSLFKDGAFS